jgi:hypothetical protein
MAMIGIKHVTAALALSLVVAAATPALAKSPVRHPGYNANAQAVGGNFGEAGVSGARAAALRKCNDEAAPLRDYTWGEEQTARYRSCMAEQGQSE